MTGIGGQSDHAILDENSGQRSKPDQWSSKVKLYSNKVVCGILIPERVKKYTCCGGSEGMEIECTDMHISSPYSTLAMSLRNPRGSTERSLL